MHVKVVGDRVRQIAFRVAGAVLLMLAAGCAGTSASPGTDAGAAGASTAGASTTGTAPTAAGTTGPGSAAIGWRSWIIGIDKSEASGVCLPTDHLLVCSVGPTGLVARSASTGAVVWSVAADSKNGATSGAAVDANRALTAGGRTLRAVDLATGRTAWTKTLPAGRTFGRPAVADGVVYAATYGATVAEPQTLFAYRAADGAQLWQRATTETAPVALGSRVVTVESGDRAVARDGRTGEVIARSDPSHPCPSLISAPGYLVCVSSPNSAGDTFPPVTLVDPDTLAFVRTLLHPGDKPDGGVIAPDGVLVLRTVNAEDSSGGGVWTAVDVRTGRTLWKSADGETSDDVVLVGTRVVWISAGRLVSVDPRKGPHATGADAPRRSPLYPEAADGRYPDLLSHGTHVVLRTASKPTLRSVTAP